MSQNDFIQHHGVKDQKWGVRRYQNLDGSLTELGRRRLGYGERRKAKEDAKKKNLLSNPVKAAKKAGHLTAKELKSAVEKAELANKLRELSVQGKRKDRDAKLEALTALEAVKDKHRNSKAEARKTKEQAKLHKFAAEVKKAETMGKFSAEKWTNKAKSLKNIVSVATDLKTITDDAGLTNKKSGTTIFGSLFTALGIKPLAADNKDKDNKDKDNKDKDNSNKNVQTPININNYNDFGDLAKLLKTSSPATPERKIYTIKRVAETTKDAVKDMPMEEAKKVKEEPGMNTFKVKDLSQELSKYTGVTGLLVKNFTNTHEPKLNLLTGNSEESTRTRRVLKMPEIKGVVENASKTVNYSQATTDRWFKFGSSSSPSTFNSGLGEIPFITIKNGGIPMPIPLFNEPISGHVNVPGSYTPKAQPDIRNKLDKIDPKKWQIKHSDDEDGMTYEEMLALLRLASGEVS